MAFQTSSGGLEPASFDDELGEEQAGSPASVGLYSQEDARLFECSDLTERVGLGARSARNQRYAEVRCRLTARVVEVDVHVVAPRQRLRLKDEVLATHAVRDAARVRIAIEHPDSRRLGIDRRPAATGGG